MKKALVAAVVVLSLGAFSIAQAVDVTFRLGQGGLRDERAPDGILGGGQLALDFKMGKRPITISISQEYHTKDPVADSCYEIGSLFAVNGLYRAPVVKERVNVYLGGGIGVLAVGAGSDAMEKGLLFDAVSGINIRAFWKIGFYIEGKYIYSKKTRNDIKVIDFSNVGALVGISLDFAISFH